MASPATQKVALITGIGSGTGIALAKRFAAGGYRVAMLARDAKRLNAYAAEDPSGALVPFPCDVADFAQLEATVAQVKTRLGPISVVLHNAVQAASMGSFLDAKIDDFERNFRVNASALLKLSQLTVPDMIAAGGGVFMATGNTSAYRGKPSFAAYAPTKAAQRILLEAIARTSGPKGVHAAYVVIDAAIDMEPIRSKWLADKPDEYFCKPVDIAEECFRVAHQPRSAWAFDVVIRPFGESW
ncbi:short-chain dehydrogenase/reductase SDR [Hyaloraphidium curvatum]|nr:short-chain dehydrogenase/reductase SDR [Hyaloraphidium curvatum]